MTRFQPQVFSGVKVLSVSDKEVYYSQGNSVYKTDHDFQQKQFLGKFNSGFILNLLARFRWVSRLGRLGFHALYMYKDTLIGIQRGHIVMLDRPLARFVSVFSDFKGSRPLSLMINPAGTVYFGEYFGNPDREAVHIFKSDNGRDWSCVYTFEPGSIRHVHGLVWDRFKHGIWVLTGDSDNESGLWFTDDDFKTLTKYSDSSQRSRCVEMIPMAENELLVPMDTPLTTNYVNWYSVISGQFTPVLEVEGSIFHITQHCGVIGLSTVTEPSEVNTSEYVHVYVSLDGRQWAKLVSLQKDVVPVSKQKYFGYAELSFSNLYGRSEYLYAHAKAVKRYDGKTLRWKIADIKGLLNDQFH